MGFQTNISILNDHLDWIEKNPETFVRAITEQMNYGTKSPLKEVHARDMARRRGEDYYDPNYPEHDAGREARLHYVTVHEARHADKLQIIHTHQNTATPVHELPWAIEKGYLEIHPRMVDHYREIASDLRGLADELDKALDRFEDSKE